MIQHPGPELAVKNTEDNKPLIFILGTKANKHLLKWSYNIDGAKFSILVRLAS